MKNAQFNERMPPTKADLEQRIVELQPAFATKRSNEKNSDDLRKKLRAQDEQMKDGAETVKRMHYMDVGPKKTNVAGKEDFCRTHTASQQPRTVMTGRTVLTHYYRSQLKCPMTHILSCIFPQKSDILVGFGNTHYNS